MKKLIYILILLLPLGGMAQDPNETGILFIKHKNISLDKQSHIQIGSLLGFTVPALWVALNPDRKVKKWEIWLASLATGFIAGCAKEGIDMTYPDGKFDWGDVGCTMGGSFVGGFGLSFTIPLDGKKSERDPVRLRPKKKRSKEK